MKDLEKLMSKSGKSEMSEDAKRAKMEVIMELMEMAKEMMADGVHKGMSDMKAPKEVSVMAADQEGLEEGLDMAKDLVESEEGPEHESLEDVAEMVADDAPSMVEAQDANKPEMEEDEEESMFGKAKKDSPKKKMFNMFDDED